MPTYARKCRRCGNEFEVFREVRNRNRAPCPKCHGRSKYVPVATRVSMEDKIFPLVLEHVAPGGVEVRSKKHMAEVCKQHEVVSHWLE